MEANFRGLGFEDGDLAVVTGAGSGIGRATALMLARSGVTIVAWDMAEGSLEDLVAEIKDLGGQVYKVVADVTDDDAVESAWEEIDRLGQPVPYLVNNAGPPSTTTLTVKEGARQAIGSYVQVTEVWLKRHANEARSVTFTASTAGNAVAGGTQPWYPTVKAGIAGYMRHLAVQLRGQPRSNAIAPGLTATPRTTVYFTPEAEERLKQQPMGRAAQPEEQAAGICFLLSPAASFINGVLLPIDGAVWWMPR